MALSDFGEGLAGPLSVGKTFRFVARFEPLGFVCLTDLAYPQNDTPLWISWEEAECVFCAVFDERASLIYFEKIFLIFLRGDYFCKGSI